MKCHQSNLLKPYFDGKLSSVMARHLEEHIAQCDICSKELEAILDGTPVADELLAEQMLSPDFTEHVMNGIAFREKSEPRPGAKQINWKQRSIKIMKITGIAVAGLTVALTLGTMVSPTFANYVNSLFDTVRDADNGMKKAAVEGYVQPIGKQVTDKGITVTVKEVLADPIRLKLIVDVVDQNGKKLVDPNEMELKLKLTFTAANGTDLNPEGGGWSYGKYGEYLMISMDMYDMIRRTTDIPEALTVGVEFRNVGGTEGTWKLQVPVDMKKAKNAAKTVPIQQTYTTSQGIKIMLDNIMTVPSASLLTLETDWTADKEQQLSELLKRNGWEEGTLPPKRGSEITEAYMMNSFLSRYGLAYEFVDEQGNVVAGWDDLRYEEINQIKKNTLKNTTIGESEKGHHMVRWNGFVPFADNQKLTFRLHSIYLYEPASFTARIQPEQLGKQPVSVESGGSSFRFANLQMKRTEEPETIGGNMWRGKGAIIEVEGTLPPDIVSAELWVARDEQGNEYAVSDRWTYSRGEDGRVKMKGALLVKGMEQLPKQLTFSYRIQEHQYRDVNWEVPIKF